MKTLAARKKGSGLTFLFLGLCFAVVAAFWQHNLRAVVSRTSQDIIGSASASRLQEAKHGRSETPGIGPSAAVRPAAGQPMREALAVRRIATDAPVAIRVAAILPPLQLLREEAAINPHVTPPSLVNFFVEAHESLEQALESEPAAEAWLTEVSELLAKGDDSSEVHEVVEATLLEHAKTLAERYPALTQACKRLWRQTSGRVRQLVG